MSDSVDVAREGKYTTIGGALHETPSPKPWQKRALPSSASLSHAVNGLLDATYAGSTVGAERSVSGRCVAIHDLAVL
eukprot:4127937-Pleurochrysis_carterae.AAC.2